MDSQERAYLGVFLEIVAIRMKTDAMVGSDILAADDVEQFGEPIDDAIG